MNRVNARAPASPTDAALARGRPGVRGQGLVARHASPATDKRALHGAATPRAAFERGRCASRAAHMFG
jgi:hypothetical protein